MDFKNYILSGNTRYHSCDFSLLKATKIKNYIFPTVSMYVVINGGILPPPPDAPIVALFPGRNLDLDRVTEGDDVYFECRVHANPAIRGGVVWRHNVSEGHTTVFFQLGGDLVIKFTFLNVIKYYYRNIHMIV